MGRVMRSLKHGWNLFQNEKPDQWENYGSMSQSPRAARSPARYFNDRSFIGSIYTRMAIDFASVEFYHARLNENGVATEIIADPLNDCLTLDPNIDQSSAAFKQDIAMTMFENGHAAIVPIDATMDPLASGSYDIKSLRVGRVIGWRPRHVTVEVYDDRERDDEGNLVNGGIVKQITVPKDVVCIIENPFYTVMNEPNGLFQRLITKLNLLDSVDEAAGSGKLDIIFQLPYTVRGESRRAQAESRRKDLEDQLKNSEHGIGYIDVSEKVIQLNRPVDNNLLTQIEYLANQVMAELGLTPEIMNGTASRDVLNNYYDRTIEPIANAIALEIKRKFLTKTARTQRHSIEIYRDPLKLIPLSELAEVADKLIRNRVISVDEFRPKIGFPPSGQPGADQLVNPNMPVEDQLGSGGVTAPLQLAPKEVEDEGLSGGSNARTG